MAKRPRVSSEVRERAVRLVDEHEKEHTSQWAAITSIASTIGCSAQTLSSWIKRRAVDTGRRAGVGVFCPGGARPLRAVIVSFIDAPREEFGVEPICTQLQAAPSWYYEQKAREADPSRVPARTQRDSRLRPEIARVWRANRCVYGAKKVWKAVHREGRVVARCTVARLRVRRLRD